MPGRRSRVVLFGGSFELDFLPRSERCFLGHYVKWERFLSLAATGILRIGFRTRLHGQVPTWFGQSGIWCSIVYGLFVLL